MNVWNCLRNIKKRIKQYINYYLKWGGILKKEDLLNTDVDYIIVKDQEGNVIDEIKYNNIKENKSALLKLKEKLLQLKSKDNKKTKSK